MVIGSHNSWTYLKVRRWWLRPFEFMARCQRVSIREQYALYGVRCFDLRIRFNDDGELVVAHGKFEYDITAEELSGDLRWISSHGNCYVRVLHEVRSAKQYTELSTRKFVRWCKNAIVEYPGIQFWCGRNLYDWEFDYFFGPEPVCIEQYASVCRPQLIDDWWPWVFAHRKNREILSAEYDADILLIDFVDIK